mgnify:CR=1 FL=1
MQNPERIHEVLDKYILTRVQTPAQYLGGELNEVVKDPAQVDVAVGLLFPDTYSVGMSHVGYQILYRLLNDLEWCAAERAYMPWPDMQEQMREYDIPLFTLENFRPVRELDTVGFTLQYEMLCTNVLMMLSMAEIPIERTERSGDDPVVIAGGPGAANPEPMSRFIDLFFVGDGEESLPAYARLVKKHHECDSSRQQLVREAARNIQGVYAPGLYRPSYTEAGTIQSVQPVGDDVPPTVEAAKVHDLDSAPSPGRPLVPLVESVHERISLEIMRGCTRGCRFCQAGMTRRPARCRSRETLMETAEEAYDSTGYDQVSLASLSSSDHPQIEELVTRCADRFEDRDVDVSLPSLRVSDQLRFLAGPLSNVRKSSVTVAPEAATERLRSVINKDITEEDLMDGVKAAYEAGWQHVKLYFMIGLPTETKKDVKAIAHLCDRVSDLRREVETKPGKVNVSVAPFVPKAHTPFQWEPMAELDYLKDMQSLLLDEIENNRVRFKFHTPERSVIEGLLARGDRRLGSVIKDVWQQGGQLEAWDEFFRRDRWQQALQRHELDADFYISRSRPRDERLPWDHISFGLSREFLCAEAQRAREGRMTPDCRRQGCTGCGVCENVE